jgi:glycosyltransferase involved in cell wall biosynthesis
VDAIIVQSQVQREQLARLDRATAERAQVVPCGISGHQPADSLDLGVRRQLLGMTQSAAIVGCVVDALDLRCVELFLDAARALCMDYPSLEFALIGAEVDRPEYHDLAHARGLMGASVFIDPHHRLFRALSALNILVTPQTGWPSGMLALQALAQDVGVVGVRGGEVEEMLAGAPGISIAGEDTPEALGDAIIQQLGAAAERMPMSGETVDAPGISELLVSRDFYDLSAPWARSGSASAPAEDGQQSTQSAIAAFGATRVTRALVAVYHSVLDQ